MPGVSRGFMSSIVPLLNGKNFVSEMPSRQENLAKAIFFYKFVLSVPWDGMITA
jgi:hypothetical protein